MDKKHSLSHPQPLLFLNQLMGLQERKYTLNVDHEEDLVILLMAIMERANMFSKLIGNIAAEIKNKIIDYKKGNAKEKLELESDHRSRIQIAESGYNTLATMYNSLLGSFKKTVVMMSGMI